MGGTAGCRERKDGDTGKRRTAHWWDANTFNLTYSTNCAAICCTISGVSTAYPAEK